MHKDTKGYKGFLIAYTMVTTQEPSMQFSVEAVVRGYVPCTLIKTYGKLSLEKSQHAKESEQIPKTICTGSDERQKDC